MKNFTKKKKKSNLKSLISCFIGRLVDIIVSVGDNGILGRSFDGYAGFPTNLTRMSCW